MDSYSFSIKHTIPQQHASTKLYMMCLENLNSLRKKLYYTHRQEIFQDRKVDTFSREIQVWLIR